MFLKWSELYGRGRVEKCAAAKNLHTKRNFLPKSDYYDLEKGNGWETHYESMMKESKKKNDLTAVKETVEKKERKQKKHRIDYNIKSFGNEVSRTYDVTSRDIGQHRGPHGPALPFIDREIHIVDFSPKYTDQKTGMLPSTYDSTFNPQHESYDNRAMFAETEARIQDVRSTHFNLGTFKPRKASESYDSSKRLVSDEKSRQDSSVQPNRHLSNIFKEGDWNVINRGILRTSVTADEFSEARYANQNNQMDEGKLFFGKKCKKPRNDDPDYVRTHIDFDESDGGVTSFYRKDFKMAKRNEIFKPERARANHNTKVLPRDGSPVKLSRNRLDFISFNKQLRELARSSDCTRNMERLHENHVTHFQFRRKPSALSASNQPMREPTITQNDYHAPASDCLTLKHEKQPLPKFRLLDTDAALPRPHSPVLVTETKSKHTPPKISLDDELERATTYAERQVKDRATHFTIGMDGDGRSTENTTHFKLPLGLDPKLAAAGVATAGTQINDCKDETTTARLITSEEQNENMISSMKEDYTPMETRSFTGPQERLIKNLERHPLHILPSHLFHMDPSKGPYLSKTKTDFLPPIRLTGKFTSMMKTCN